MYKYRNYVSLYIPFSKLNGERFVFDDRQPLTSRNKFCKSAFYTRLRQHFNACNQDIRIEIVKL